MMHETMEEQLLIDRALVGDERAFEALTRLHERRVFLLCERILQNRQDAEDACLETFVRAYENLRRLQAKPSIGPWLRRIATNLCISMLRKRVTRSEELLPEVVPAPDGDGVNPEAEVNLRDDARLLRQCIDRLPASDRVLLMLRYIDDRPVEEVAQVVGCSRTVLKVRLHRARQKLRKLYEQSLARPMRTVTVASKPATESRPVTAWRES